MWKKNVIIKYNRHLKKLVTALKKILAAIYNVVEDSAFF